MKYYRVTLEEAQRPIGICTQAFRFCACCRVSLSSVGGPGFYLCESCVDKMHSGKIGKALRELEKKEIRR